VFFHIGAWLSVGAFFDYFVWTCLAFFPWSHVFSRRTRAPDLAASASVNGNVSARAA
jgi:hypothetical protein